MQQLEQAASALGWAGRLIPGVRAFGARFAAVARIRPEVHRWRSEHGWDPELDPAWCRSWSVPSIHDHVPVPAVDLLGVLVPVSRASRGARACGMLLTLAPCAVVLPDHHPYQPWPMTELDYYGIGAVIGGAENPPEVALRPEDRTREFGLSLFGRWLLEVLYSRMLCHEPENAGLH